VEPMLDAFERIAATVTYRVPQIPVISNVTGQLASGDDLVTPAYWRRQARAAVRFADSLQTLRAQDVGYAVEIGPSPTLSALVRRTLNDRLTPLPSVRSGQSDWTSMIDTL